jgi:cytochrome c peroxidase
MNKGGSPFAPASIAQRRKPAIGLGIVIMTWFALMTCRGEDIAALRARASEVFGPLPARMPGAEQDTPAMVRLGRKLFFDKRLSANKTVSCNTCHPLSDNGAYPGPTARGASGKQGERNSPTVLNAGFQFAQFWDGRALDLVAQAKEPMVNPNEMDMPAGTELFRRLREARAYQKIFPQAFPQAPDPFTIENLARALAAFERTLITHDRFDDFLNGKNRALTWTERKGLRTFMETGCGKCHDGPGLGGTSYQKIGRYHPYANTNDLGRARITHEETDRYKFKVPSLRNVALTAPYFHDGQVATLDSAVRQMAYLQLDTRLSEADTESISTFLHALSDKGLALRQPAHHRSGLSDLQNH